MSNQKIVTLGSGAMFDVVAPRYDLLNRILSMGLDQSWRRAAVSALDLGASPFVLDLATGTGDLAIMLARRHPGARIVGLDSSKRMLERCRRKLETAGMLPRVALVVGDAQSLPFGDACFDAVTMAFGIRNLPDRPRALAEMSRVLKPGGRAAILELTEPRGGIVGRLARLYLGVLVPRLGALLSAPGAYRYLRRSIIEFPHPDEFAAMLRRAGFEKERMTPFTFGVCHLFLAMKRG
jgi:demethylmenaquinone methyltransferase/2-methoxy-6-polyprenyl-1,4-benzoquinol methylase